MKDRYFFLKHLVECTREAIGPGLFLLKFFEDCMYGEEEKSLAVV